MQSRRTRTAVTEFRNQSQYISAGGGGEEIPNGGVTSVNNSLNKPTIIVINTIIIESRVPTFRHRHQCVINLHTYLRTFSRRPLATYKCLGVGSHSKMPHFYFEDEQQPPSMMMMIIIDEGGNRTGIAN